jgi:hypothetical protein
MKYAVDMGPGAMIYIPSILMIGLGVQQSLEADTHTDTQTAR